MAKKQTTKEHVIFTSLVDDVEDWRNGFNEWCNINGFNPEEKDIYDYINDEINDWWECEQYTLNVPCGTIIAIADLGLWNGRKSAYKIINSGNLKSILSYFNCDDVKVYVDRYDVKADCYHHDGTNHITYRLIKENVNIQPLLDKIYNQEEVTQAMISRYTKSLKNMVKNLYRWK